MTRSEYLEFHQEFSRRALALSTRKNSDYAGDADPFRNFRQFEELGFLVRMSDKLSRLKTFCERGTLSVAEESVTDTLLDLANYAILMAAYIEDKNDQRRRSTDRDVSARAEEIARATQPHAAYGGGPGALGGNRQASISGYDYDCGGARTSGTL